jgi:hypothetical protein
MALYVNGNYLTQAGETSEMILTAIGAATVLYFAYKFVCICERARYQRGWLSESDDG